MPHQFTRRILVCVTGLTPQVVTETLYALARQDPAWIPTEVHILTTVTGAKRARLLLLEGERAHFPQLCRDWDLPPIGFDPSHIHVLTDPAGRPLEDIRSQGDNVATADAILGAIAGFTSDADAAIHVSLAGGRKSMGFFAGYALSLYGREQDRLSHVLVSEGFETNPEFFFPPRQPKVLIGRNGEPLSTADARVELADIPFVRLRDHLPAALLPGASFADAVAAAQRLSGPARLRLRVSDRTLICGNDIAIRLTPLNFAVYAWHADRARRLADPAVPQAEFNREQSSVRQELYQFGCRLYPNELSAEGEQWRNRPWFKPGENHMQWLSERRSRINRAIGKVLVGPAARRYCITSRPLQGRQAEHLLELPAEAIRFEP